MTSSSNCDGVEGDGTWRRIFLFRFAFYVYRGSEVSWHERRRKIIVRAPGNSNGDMIRRDRQRRHRQAVP